MTLDLLPLDDRSAPAVWYGGELWLAGRSVHPFEGWNGDLVSVLVGDVVHVGAGDGGGPRVGVFDARTGERTRPDYWAGDPDSRAGVAFVVPLQPREEPPAPPAPPGVPDVTHGPPDAFTVYIDFEAPADVPAVMAELHRLQPDVRITSKRPDLRPDRYGTAVLDGSLDHDDRHPSGIAYADWTDGQPFGVSEAVFVDARHTLTPRDMAKMLDHEIRHGLELIPDWA
jgi:hypothetical protein